MTKVLINTDLNDVLLQRIQNVSEKIEIITVSSEGKAMEIMPEVEVVLGPLPPAMFALGDRLRWIQNLGAAVDSALFPEFVESGAGLDVVPQEPLPDNHPLWHMPNVVVTPHTAGAHHAARDEPSTCFATTLPGSSTDCQ